MTEQSVLTLIDAGLARTAHREQFTSNEVADLLLDIRAAAVLEPVPA